MTSMKAVLWTKYGSPDLLNLGEVVKPIPKDDEVLVKIHASNVTPGDCEIRRFDMHVLFWFPVRIYMGLFKPKRPILGMELSGEIEAVGKNVNQFKVGDHVAAGTGMGLGAYAEYKCLKESAFMSPKPSNLSFEEATTIPTGGTNALHYIRKANLQSGQKVLIIGAAGCFGTYTVQLAKLAGVEVTAVDSTDKLEALRSIGADNVIDFTKDDFVKNGEVYDVIFDIAGKNSVSRNMKSLKNNGRYILATPWVKQVLQGLWSSVISGKKFIFSLANERIEDLVYLTGLIEAGKLKPVIDRIYPLEKTVQAHHRVESGQKIGHVVISMNNPAAS